MRKIDKRERLTERYDVESIRVLRGELCPWPKTDGTPLSEIIDGIVPGGSVFHILNDIPEDTGIELTVLLDGKTVVYFELPWARKRTIFGRYRAPTHVLQTPVDVELWTLVEFRRKIGQGKTRILLDKAVADATRILA